MARGAMVDPRASATELVREFERLFGPRLRSALLCGSVARGEAVEGVSDINVMVLLDRIDAEVLRSASPAARRWVQAGNTAPLLMAWNEWQRAEDAFAIELADMRDAHVVLHGADPLEGLAVQREALRLQAERELRGKLLQLREGMLIAAEAEEDVGRLLLVALPSFVTYLRAALRLAGRAAPVESPAAIEQGAALVGADPSAFLRTWEARARRTPLSARVDDALVAGYFDTAERTADFVDNLPQETVQE
jgi:hypothetical protein